MGTSSFSRFAPAAGSAFIQMTQSPEEIGATPGSINVASQYDAEADIYKKTITFRMELTGQNLQKLERYRSMDIAALYVDDKGNRRVSGSPSYPLALAYNQDGAAYAVTLSGADPDSDFYVLND